jgi:hypothetical protein
MNPKGPETGKIKVFRGESYSTHEWRCQSEFRAGDPQVNRDAGLSFSVVKDE